jgi:hypothetical protein
MNALLELRKHEQSVWLDYIRRDLALVGALRESFARRASTEPRAIYDEIATGDVRNAASTGSLTDKLQDRRGSFFRFGLRSGVGCHREEDAGPCECLGMISTV